MKNDLDSTSILHRRRDRLESWKEIAAYFERDVRTVERWEKEFDLPVRRNPKQKRGAVFAYRSELEAWRASQGSRTRPARPGRGRFLIPALVVGIAIALVPILRRSERVSQGDAHSQEQITAFPFTSGAVSPDGRWLVYRDAERAFLWRRTMAADSGDQLLVAQPAFSPIVWSPDSRAVACRLGSGTDVTLAHIDVESGVVVSIVKSGKGSIPVPLAYSADASSLVCRLASAVRGETELAYFPLAGGEPRLLRRIPAQASFVRLSPDHRFISYSLQEDIYLLSSQPEGSPIRLTDDPKADLDPVWSWDSAFLFFVRGWNTQTNRSVYRIRVDESPVREFRIGPAGDFHTEVGLSVSRTGDLYLGRRFESARVAVVGWDPENEVPTSDHRNDFQEVSYADKWTEDGWLEYTNYALTDTASLDRPIRILRDLETGEEKMADPPSEMNPPGFSRRIYRTGRSWGYAFRFSDGEIFTFDLRTGDLARFMDLGEPLRHVRPSHDGNWLAAVTYSGNRNLHTLYLINVEHRDLTRLATARLKPFPRWSPNDKEIAFSDANCLMLLSREGHELKQLVCAQPPSRLPEENHPQALFPRLLWGNVMNPSWSPDGRWIAWAAAREKENRVDLLAVNRESGEHRVLYRGGAGLTTTPRGPEWSPGGGWIAFTLESHPLSEIWRVPRVVPLQ